MHPLLTEPKLMIEPGAVARLSASHRDEQRYAVAGVEFSTHSGPVIAGSVGLLPVIGPLSHSSDWLTTYSQLGAGLQALLADSSVREIVLYCNSPGGSVAGCMELADDIYAGRDSKPITAIVDSNAFSAAYALASAASQIIVTPSGGVGSIGVIAIHMNMAKMLADWGLELTPVYAGARKVDFAPWAPLSDDARAVLEAEIARDYTRFVNTVARNRGLSPGRVRSTDAGLFFGEAGFSAGLADQLLPANRALAEIVRRNAVQPQPVQQMVVGRIGRAARAMEILAV